MLNLKNLSLRLTTECGYRWHPDYAFYWKNARFRRLYNNDYHLGGTTNELVGIAYGPLMFFWKKDR